SLGAQHLPVYALPRMDTFLRNNGPWSQLVSLGNIDLRPAAPDLPISPSPRLQVTPLLVPHRDEFSETVAWQVKGPEKTLLYLPDIDKWDRWERDIRALIRTVDYAFLDATFFDGDELPNRDMAEIPHPFVVESLALFEGLPAEERAKIIFTHFNHSNPLLQAGSAARVRVEAAGMHVAAEGMVLGL
ncbi:MAG: pyrroloquinoline quinone biosynthesis protein PqqB, partial [Lewinella sp.]|nr:pyrroloquinoline quinone biosynthesis protein PqqB [Lewinella sp.]